MADRHGGTCAPAPPLCVMGARVQGRHGGRRGVAALSRPQHLPSPPLPLPSFTHAILLPYPRPPPPSFTLSVYHLPPPPTRPPVPASLASFPSAPRRAGVHHPSAAAPVASRARLYPMDPHRAWAAVAAVIFAGLATDTRACLPTPRSFPLSLSSFGREGGGGLPAPLGASQVCCRGAGAGGSARCGGVDRLPGVPGAGGGGGGGSEAGAW